MPFACARQVVSAPGRIFCTGKHRFSARIQADIEGEEFTSPRRMAPSLVRDACQAAVLRIAKLPERTAGPDHAILTSMSTTLIRNGKIVNADRTQEADLL